MNQNLEKLIEIQEIDKKIISLQNERKSIISEFERLCSDFNERKSLFEEEKKQLNTKEIESKEYDLELAELKEKYDKLSKQRMEVRTPKQLNAIDNEIIAIRKKISETEDKQLKLLEEIEKLKKEVQERKQLFDEDVKKIEEMRLKNEKSIPELDSKLTELNKQRLKYTVDIDNEYLRRYDYIMSKKQDFALASLRGTSCAGCNLQLPPQLINDIKKGEEIITCQSCSRILYYKPE